MSFSCPSIIVSSLLSLYPLYSSVSLPNWLLFVQQNSGWEPSCVCLCPLLASSECFNDLIAGLCVSVGRCSTHGQVNTWLVFVILIKDRCSTTGNIIKAHYEVSIQLSAYPKHTYFKGIVHIPQKVSYMFIQVHCIPGLLIQYDTPV